MRYKLEYHDLDDEDLVDLCDEEDFNVMIQLFKNTDIPINIFMVNEINEEEEKTA